MSAEIVQNKPESVVDVVPKQPDKHNVFMLQFKELLIEDRHRKDHGDLMELSREIAKQGLIHPIVVRPIAVTDKGLKYKLVAGERRSRAMFILGWAQCPATLRADLEITLDGTESLKAELLAKEIEYSENINRQANTMIESAELTKRIHDIKVKLNGQAIKGTSGGWRLQDTATYVAKDRSHVGRQIKLAEHLEKHPEKKDALSKLDINTALRRIKQDERTATVTGKIDSGQMELHADLQLGDAFELIKSVGNESQHLIITDPPFGLDEIQSTLGGTKGTSGTYTALLSEGDNSTFGEVTELMDKLVPEMFRVLKPSSHIYIFTSGELLLHLIPLMKRTGFLVCENILIWDKKKTTTPFKGLEYPSAYEPIIFAHKPPREKHLLLPDCNNILRFPPLHTSKKIHRFQKPVDLMSHLIRNSSRIGDNVLDPFAGSGVTVRLAKELKRNALGFELDKGNWTRAQIVLSEGVVKAQEILCAE